MWEVSIRKFPVKGLNKTQITGEVVGKHQRPGKPEDCCIRPVQSAVAVYWKEDPQERRGAAELLNILEVGERAAGGGCEDA